MRKDKLQDQKGDTATPGEAGRDETRDRGQQGGDYGRQEEGRQGREKSGGSEPRPNILCWKDTGARKIILKII